MIDVELHNKAIDILVRNFNLITAINCKNFDTEPIILENHLRCYQNRFFDTKDKILLVHMDTDYYDPLLPCGMIPINVIRIFQNLDIPLHSLLFVTNHFGIKKEFDLLLEHQHPKDRPQIIETLLSKMTLTENYDFIQPPKFDEIEKSAMCMMKNARSHRIAFYNFLVDNHLLDKVAVSQRFDA